MPWLLWIVLLWTWVCLYPSDLVLFEYMHLNTVQMSWETSSVGARILSTRYIHFNIRSAAPWGQALASWFTAASPAPWVVPDIVGAQWMFTDYNFMNIKHWYWEPKRSIFLGIKINPNILKYHCWLWFGFLGLRGRESVKERGTEKGSDFICTVVLFSEWSSMWSSPQPRHI